MQARANATHLPTLRSFSSCGFPEYALLLGCICAKLTGMKQDIRLSLFALLLLIFLPTKQIFALGASNYRWQNLESDSAALMGSRVNDHRQQADLPSYATNESLRQAAQKIADHMATTEFISHFDGDGANPTLRAERFGYTDHVTEIIYGGFGGVNAAWEWWLANELHQNLILSEDYYEFGVGMAVGVESGRFYWAIVFGTGLPADEEPAPAATLPDSQPKLPVTATTAVPAPSPTAEQIPTEMAVAAILETPTLVNINGSTPSGAIALTDEGLDSSLATDEIVAIATPQDTWLIIAAAVTILFGILIFYFPRASWSR
jgi:uncharacterized protein YkwD